MRLRRSWALGLTVAIGCGSPHRVVAPVVPRIDSPPAAAEPAIAQVRHDEPAPATVDDWVNRAIARHPRLAKAGFAIDAATGRFVQAGLYPNPTVAVTGDELGDRTGPGGIITAPQVSQEIVTGGKLALSQTVAARDIDIATLELLRERYAVAATVRAAYYDLYALEKRIVALDELAAVAGEAESTGRKLLEAGQIARLDLVPLEVERVRFQSQAEAAKAERPAARKNLAAIVGDPKATVTTVAGPFDELPVYDAEKLLETVLATHPEVQIARTAIDRAHMAVHRAEAEPTPNLTVSSGYVYQGQNKSHDWLLGVSLPVPLWNKNQGNIRAARAELAMAMREVGRVEADLAERVATATRAFASSKALAEQYRTQILPKAEETYRLAREAFKGGQFEYLRVIQAQRAVAEVKLESVRALGDGWKAAAVLSGLLLEERWAASSAPSRP